MKSTGQRSLTLHGAWAHRAAWLRVLLACTLFSALQGVLGAWVVPAVAGGEVTEICTPMGVQWVPVADAQAVAGRDPQDPLPQGLAKPCVWVAAFVAALPPPPPIGGVTWGPVRACSLCLHRQPSRPTPWRGCC